jgi:quercetin dioxygenase-like cupin family protein
MHIPARFLVAICVLACAVAGVALATPVVGLLFSNILANGNTTTPEIFTRARVALPPVAGQEQGDDDNNEWTGMLFLHGPTNVEVQDFGYAVNGHTGWHSHPGMLAFTLISGTIEWYDANCNKTVYNTGDTFTENTATHYFRNVGAAPMHGMVTYFLAKGQPRRIDQPAPACAAALGLE